MRLSLTSANRREFSSPNCDVVPIIDCTYLNNNVITGVLLRVCLETDRFFDVKGREFTFSNCVEMIERIKLTIGAEA